MAAYTSNSQNKSTPATVNVAQARLLLRRAAQQTGNPDDAEMLMAIASGLSAFVNSLGGATNA